MRRAIISATILAVLSAHPASASSDSGESVSEPESEPTMARVRLTFYVESGRTYSGQQTYAGSTACSWNWPIGTRFRLPNDEVVTCVDRGRLGSSGWLDLWRRADLARDYGPYALVEVLRD